MHSEICSTSNQGTVVVASALKGYGYILPYQSSRGTINLFQGNLYQSSFQTNQIHANDRDQRRAIKDKTSEWLNVVPLESCHFDLAPSQFRDGLTSDLVTVMYVVLISHCNIPLDCKAGGLAIKRHNEIWDCLGDVATQIWNQVVHVPVIKRLSPKQRVQD